MANSPLWTPPDERIKGSQLFSFAQSQSLENLNFEELHRWSVNNREEFWNGVWEYCDIRGDRGSITLNDPDDFLGSRWFPEAKLNFAENLLRYNDDATALIQINEMGDRKTCSYRELHRRVQNFRQHLLNQGVTKGDRVVGWLPNVVEAVVAMLASASIGAIWSSCSPDFGVEGALDRFGQIEPKVLVACTRYRYNGKEFIVQQNVEQVVDSIPSIEAVVWYDSEDDDDFDGIDRLHAPPTEFAQLPFDHPLYVMYSSGTTGKPKCIAHGAGGTLLQHVKEHRLHVDLRREDVLFFFTTTGWMMWNWLVSGLATGCTLVLFDGAPFYPKPHSMLQHIDACGISVFGVGAKYIASLEKLRVRPAERYDLSSLKTILSTGSPLSHESFRYVYREFKNDVWLASISGGTDLISCFVLGNPFSSVNEGQIQGPGLGMAVNVYDSQAKTLRGERGELVCEKSFPSKPIGFWNDNDDVLYKKAYFSTFENVWAHGDFAEIDQETGGYIIHGRSDAVLNPGGVRIGTAEIYRQIEAIPEIQDAVCVGQEWQGDTRIVLFVVMQPDKVFTSTVEQTIRKRIRTHASPRHVPSVILEVEDIPMTRSGKIAELAVRDSIHGREVKNTSALANPQCLEEYQNLRARLT